MICGRIKKQTPKRYMVSDSWCPIWLGTGEASLYLLPEIFQRSEYLSKQWDTEHSDHLKKKSRAKQFYCDGSRGSRAHVQVASYYKMLRKKIEPRHRSDQTTSRISMKFCMVDPFDHTNGIIEGFFEIRPLGRVMGPRRADPGGVKNRKKFFFIFVIFSISQVRLMS